LLVLRLSFSAGAECSDPNIAKSESSTLLCGLQVGMQFFLVFKQHFRELDPVSHLRVAGNDCAQRKYRSVDLETHFENGPDGKWEDALDIATAFAEIGSRAAEGNIVTRDIQLNRDPHLDAR
jgi:hypothetical protein